MASKIPSNDEKQRVWNAYRERRPVRVPATYGINPRIVIFDPRWNPKGYSFEEYYRDARVTVEMQLQFMEFQAQYLNQYCDNPLGRPDAWRFYVDNQNIHDAAYFGSTVTFRDEQVPDTTPILAGSDKHRIFEFDIDHPLDNPFIKECLGRHEALTAAAGSLSYHGITADVAPLLMGFDGHITTATCLRGDELFLDIIADPDYFHKLLDFLDRAVRIRNKALADLFGVDQFDTPSGFHADDSIQLISLDMYREMVLPFHRRWYAQWSTGGPHGIHLCGDATRHFPTIHEELNVDSFDTGFPVDHGALRAALGPDVELRGGPEVSLLMGGTSDEVYERTAGILDSGVKHGGRFILSEANNLPPQVPEANLAAMYKACLDRGSFE